MRLNVKRLNRKYYDRHWIQKCELLDVKPNDTFYTDKLPGSKYISVFHPNQRLFYYYGLRNLFEINFPNKKELKEYL